MEFYQNIPSMVGPDILSIGSYTLKWYSMGYVFAFITVYFILKNRLKNEVIYEKSPLTMDSIENYLMLSVLGVILGGRLGYILVYGDGLSGILPGLIPFYNGKFTGFSGMSYHGGFLGVMLVTYLYGLSKKVGFIYMLNLIAPGTALGYTWGRLGNFMNGELYGRITEVPWGMYFYEHNLYATQQYLRHPSQLYEALVEGVIPFLLLWYLRKKGEMHYYLAPIYIGFYGMGRFIVEFFRQPDLQFIDSQSQKGEVFLFMTMGQTLCFIMILASLVLAYYIHKKRSKGIVLD